MTKPDLKNITTNSTQPIGVFDSEQHRCLSKKEILENLDNEISSQKQSKLSQACQIACSLAGVGLLIKGAMIGFAPITIAGLAIVAAYTASTINPMDIQEKTQRGLDQIKKDIEEIPDFSSTNIVGINRTMSIFDDKIKKCINLSEKHHDIASHGTALSGSGLVANSVSTDKNAKTAGGIAMLIGSVMYLANKIVEKNSLSVKNNIQKTKDNIFNKKPPQPQHNTLKK